MKKKTQKKIFLSKKQNVYQSCIKVTVGKKT